MSIGQVGEALLRHLSVAGSNAATFQPRSAPHDAATAEELAVLRAVLARPEFQAAQGRSVLDELLAPVRSAILSVLQELWRWLTRLPEPVRDGTGLAAIIVALVVVALAVFVVLRTARGTLAAEGQLELVRAGASIAADQELALARELAESGELRAALHHHYLAVLRRLDERRVLIFDHSLTNRELLPRLAAGSPLADSLRPLVEAFDALWYGQSSCSPQEYHRFAALAERVWQAAGP